MGDERGPSPVTPPKSGPSSPQPDRNPAAETTSHRHILRSTGIIGGSSVANVLIVHPSNPAKTAADVVEHSDEIPDVGHRGVIPSTAARCPPGRSR